MAETAKSSSSGGTLVSGDWSENLVSPSKYSLKCPHAMSPIGICLHNTANNAPAANEISYMRSNDSSTSFHFSADEKSAIQGLPLDRNGWHAGDGNGQGNRKHIGIEIARSTDYTPGVFEAAERKSAALAAKLCQRYGWGVDQIKAHRDFASKNCPHRTSMKAFKNLVSLALQNKLYENTPVTEDASTTTASSNKTQSSSNTSSTGSIAVGSKVKVTGSKYATGQTIPSWVKNNTYTVSSVSGSKCLLKEIVSWVYASDLKLVGGTTASTTNTTTSTATSTNTSSSANTSSTTASSGSIGVGSKVKVTGSKYATGQTIPSWVKNNTYTVSSVSGSKCLLKEITSWVYTSDLKLISGGTTTSTTNTTTSTTTNTNTSSSANTSSTTVSSASIGVGSKVKVTGSKYATGQTIPSWVKNNTYTVSSVSGSKCLLKEITSWVYTSDLKLISGGTNTSSNGGGGNTSSTTTTSKAYVNCDVLNVRNGAGVSHSKIGSVTRGTELTVTGESNGWLKIKYGSGTGWVSKDYTTTKKPSSGGGNAGGGGAVSASGVPLYAQGDSKWGSDLMGKSGKTIRQIGCAMTSTTMALNKTSGKSFTPKQMNTYLNGHGGYTSGGAIYWGTAAGYVSKAYTAKSYTKGNVDGELNAGRPVVISVKSEGHWVCVAGRNADGTYVIHDPAGGKVLNGKWNSSYIKVDGYAAGKCLRTFA